MAFTVHTKARGKIEIENNSCSGRYFEKKIEQVFMLTCNHFSNCIVKTIHLLRIMTKSNVKTGAVKPKTMKSLSGIIVTAK